MFYIYIRTLDWTSDEDPCWITCLSATHLEWCRSCHTSICMILFGEQDWEAFQVFERDSYKQPVIIKAVHLREYGLAIYRVNWIRFSSLMFRFHLILVHGAVCGTIFRFLCSISKVAKECLAKVLFCLFFWRSMIGEFEWGLGRLPDFFNTSEFWRSWGVSGIGRKSRDRVENEGWNYEQMGFTPIVQGEVGDGRVHILNVWEYGGFVAGNIHPIKLRLVLYVKESYR